MGSSRIPWPWASSDQNPESVAEEVVQVLGLGRKVRMWNNCPWNFLFFTPSVAEVSVQGQELDWLIPVRPSSSGYSMGLWLLAPLVLVSHRWLVAQEVPWDGGPGVVALECAG